MFYRLGDKSGVFSWAIFGGVFPMHNIVMMAGPGAGAYVVE